MKKFILLFCFLVLASPRIYSQLFVENFDYPAGDLITGHGWTAFSGGGTNPIAVVAPGLVYGGYVGYSGIGLAARIISTGEDDFNTYTARSTGNLYLSFMLRVDTARITGTAGENFIHVMDGGNTFYGRVWARDSSVAGTGKYSLGISKNATGASVLYSPAQYDIGTTYLVVLKYTFIAGAANDQVSLFVFSSGVPGSEPVTPTLGPHVGTTNSDPTSLSRVSLRQGGGFSPNARVDGIVVDTTWNNALPVELSSFSSTVNGRNVTLNWTTVNEINNSHFDVERLASQSGSSNGVWAKVGNVTGNGTSTITHNYSFTDRAVESGNYNYRLKQVDYNGNFEYFNLSNEVIIGIPEKFNLSQNYPNPFNPSTTINYELPFDSKVSIKIFDMTGREVSSLVNDFKTAGYYSINFNASNLASGIYSYRISAEGSTNNFVDTKKMILVK